MNSYKIIITPDAETDLFEIRNYIADMASSFAPIDEEPWHSIGIRKIIVKNFYIYYLVDASFDKVYVLNVIYSQRDQLNALKNMKLNF